jgi:uncharacterized protein (DUF4415 family)
MSSKPFSSEELDQLAKLEAMSDEDIDTSDIPEMTDEQWANARRYVRPVKQPVTIRLDADVVGWFKEHAGGRPYQTEINRVLRDHVTRSAKRRA